ncbi:MAG: NTP transferase domain-containing protein [Burkholderiaceae bacterium]|nr:NTP transferase domain-containing protein [Burkholderiaceae bacterium]
MKPPTLIILASGPGERFRASGGATHKLAAPLAGKTVLEHVLAAARASGLPWHLEEREHPGMGDSIAAAVAATRDAPGWLILPGDLPLIKSATILAVADALGSATVVVPTYQGQRGHPVGFAAECRPALLALSGQGGAAAIVRGQQALELVVNDLGCVTDIDTLGELRRAERLLRETPLG